MQAVGLLSNYISQGVYTVAAPFHPFGGAVDIIVVQQEDGTFKSTPWYVKFGKFQGVLKRREKIVTVSVNGREADFHMYLDHKGEAFFWKEVEPEEDETIFSPPSAPSSSDEAALPGHGGRRISFNEDNSSGGTDDARKEGTAAGDGGDETALSEPACLENGGVCRNTEEILISSSERSPGSAEKQQGESKNPNGDCCSMPLSADAKSSVKNGKTLSKTPSRTSKSIFSLVFRGKSQSFSEPQISVAVTDEKGREGETDDFRRSSLERAERVADLLDKKWATGDCANREEEMGRISSELACHSDSSRFDASLNTGCSQQPEIGINSDGVVCSSLLPSDEQVTSVVDTISGGATNGNSAGVCNHLEASTMEYLGGSIEKQGHSIQETDSERWYLESETGTFTVEDSSGKYNESRQQISKNVVARLSGCSLLLESVSGMGETTGRSADVILTSVDNGQDAIAAPVSSLDVHSAGSDIGETRLDLVADPDLIIQSAERIRTIQQVIEVPIEPITEGSDENEHKLLEHGGKQDKEDGIHVFPQKELDESSLCDGNTSVNSRLADHKFAPVEAFSQTSKQEDTGAVDFHNQLVESEANNVPQGNLQMQFYSSISESVSDLEGERKQIGQLVDEVHEPGFALQNNNDYGELDECCIQEKRTYANDMSRSECGKEFELTLNNDYNFKTCLPVSDPIPPPEKEKRQHIASLTMEEEGREYRLNEIDKTSEESALSSNHHGQPKALQTVSAHVLESSLQNSDDNSSKLSRSQTSPINITAVYIKGRVDDSLQVSGSLPNMGLHTEKEGADHVFSHSLDFGSVCLKRGMSHDIFFPNSENMESNVFEKDTMQGWTATETSTESWSTAETAIASVQPETGIEISLCRHLLLEGMGIEAANQAFDSERVSMEDFHSSGATMVKNEKLVVRIGGQYLPWDAAAPIILGMVAFGLECPVKPEGAISVERVEKTLGKYASDSLVPSGGGWRLWPFTFRRLRTPERSNSARPASKDDLMANSDAALQSSFNGTLVVKNGYHRRAGKGKVRSNTPTSEQLLSLHLKEGQNIITFTFSTRVLGKQQVDARIYLWKWNTRIVVSDVDGTITKSDVLGQFMPLVGKDWTQSGVAHLFSAIKDNGYQLLFLSARAIAQAYLTRQFLVNIKQDGKVLPDGPVVMSPDGLFPSLYREVIRRAPHEFKIACLEDIRALFPPDCNPFYAGFGNRDTDEISYLKVGIPKGKIFIINPKGEVAVNHRVDMKSYTSLHNLVNGMFPAMSSSEQEDFNSWNYWRVPLPDIDG